MAKLRVRAVIADTKKITFFLEDGSQKKYPSSDYRVAKVMERITPIINAGGIAEFELEDYSVHKVFEEQTGGMFRFVKVAASKIASLFGSKEEETKIQQERISDVISVGNVNEPVESEKETLAVITPDGTVIPEMEKLEQQFARSIRTDSKGMEKFLNRLSKVIKNRGHSVQDLLTFLEKADLPITDEGDVIAYKRLRGTNQKGVFVDCHSGNVKQQVGSYVFMDEKMVDPNRRNECSQGLHIARRAYLSSFYGDIMVICRIPPENFIAVPSYDANKVRVSGYHILAEVPGEGAKALLKNRPMTDDPASAKLLTALLRGDHIGITEMVEIGGPKGTKITITPKGEPLKLTNPVSTEEAPTPALDSDEQIPALNLKEINKRMREQDEAEAELTEEQRTAKNLLAQGFSKRQIANDVGTSTRTLGRWIDKFGWEVSDKEQKTPEKPVQAATAETKHETTQASLTVPEQALALFNNKQFERLKEFKREKKKGWKSLGFTDAEIEQIKAS